MSDGTDMIIGSKVEYFKELSSTNTYAASLLKQEQVPEGLVIYTDFQSAGRGQQGNTWESEKSKNLLFSVILYPGIIRPGEQFLISMAISLGISDFISGYVPECKIKWPNDIYVGNDKIGGILIENSILGDSIENTVAGIGLNINQTGFKRSIPNPVSLRMITGMEYDTGRCLTQLLLKLDKRYKKLLSEEFNTIRKNYLSSLYRIGEWHNFSTSKGYLYGKITSVTDSGYLQVEDEWARVHSFMFKEIEFMP